MTLSVRAFTPADAEPWDDFCRGAHQATFLHSRRFLSYHGDRFVDRSLVIERAGSIEALLPAAQDLCEPDCVVSHPGLTYGGFVHDHRLVGQQLIEGLQLAMNHFRSLGYRRLVYKAVPHIYHRVPAQDDLYALFRAGARRVRCDLSSTIDLAHRRSPSSRRRRGRYKADKAAVSIVGQGVDASAEECLSAFWKVLESNLASRHGVRPTHSLQEICLLSERFPDSIRALVARVHGRVVAGAIFFVTPVVWHAQYIASDDEGRQTCALDAVFEHAITAAARSGARWFDFGVSNEQSGKTLNAGLYQFKSEFGGGGTVHEFYELAL